MFLALLCQKWYDNKNISHTKTFTFYEPMHPSRASFYGFPPTTTNIHILSESAAAVQWEKDEEKSKWIVRRKDGIFYNPAYEGVRQYVAEGAAEIAANYDVDGIHFDDYFYPTEDESFDAEEYTAYKEAVSDSGDEAFMREALLLAQEAAAEGEVPVGAVVVYEGRVIARGRNRREKDKNALSHAELEAIAAEYEKIKSRERPKSKNRSLLFRSAAPQATKQKEKSTPYEFD